MAWVVVVLLVIVLWLLFEILMKLGQLHVAIAQTGQFVKSINIKMLESEIGPEEFKAHRDLMRTPTVCCGNTSRREWTYLASIKTV